MRLMARWSCSTILFRYLFCRNKRLKAGFDEHYRARMLGMLVS
jgi:hypothetical protein